MGCKCGPSVANLYLYILEKNWVSLNSSSILYKRFIDDIFIASTTELDLNEFSTQFNYLKLNINNDKSVIFLDLKIKFEPLTKKLVFNLYIKPTNSCSYLMPISNHPKHIFDNIPVSLFTRIRRICTFYTDYLANSRNLIVQLVKQGYDLKKVTGISRSIGKKSRSELLPYKNKVNEKNTNLKYFIHFEQNFGQLNNLVKDSFDKIKMNSSYIKDKKLMIVNKIEKNMGSLFILNFKLSNTKNLYSDKCNKTECKTCKYTEKSYYVYYKNYSIPIQSNSNCDSLGIVYIIKCKKCNIFYIGESYRSARTRISDHLYSIKKFSKNIRKSLVNFEKCSEVSIHFNISGHKEEDFSFYLFKSELNNDLIRKSTETDLINFFLKFEIPIINKKIPKIEHIKTLTFSEICK
jgi:hypothetical protein